MTKAESSTILAFDVGEQRIGVAKATVPPRVAQPLMTLPNDDAIAASLKGLIDTEKPDALVVGLPRNMQGEKTAQTRSVEAWASQYLVQLGVPIRWQDESLTSVAAEEHLGKRRGGYSKGDVDALAASVILTDFLETL